MRVKNKHLLAKLTQPVDTWKSVILPTFFNWLVSQEDPWNQPQNAIVEVLETICRANIRGSYTLKRDGDTSGVKSAEFKRVSAITLVEFSLIVSARWPKRLPTGSRSSAPPQSGRSTPSLSVDRKYLGIRTKSVLLGLIDIKMGAVFYLQMSKQL